MALARTLIEMGRRNDAVDVLKFFERTELNDPLRARGLYQLADVLHLDPQQQARALGLVDELLREHAEFEHRDAALYLSGIIQRKLDRESADEAFTELVKNHHTSKYWSDALYRLAESAAAEDKVEAKKYLTRLISAERDRQVLPHALYLKGRLESDEKNWAAARETLRDLLRKFPGSSLVPVARYGVAESFFQQKEYDRAMLLFEILAAGKFAPSDSWGAMIQLRRAQLLVRQQELVSAIRVADKVESDFPDFSLQHEVDYLVARAYAARGEYSSARKYYHKVVSVPTWKVFVKSPRWRNG